MYSEYEDVASPGAGAGAGAMRDEGPKSPLNSQYGGLHSTHTVFDIDKGPGSPFFITPAGERQPSPTRVGGQPPLPPATRAPAPAVLPTPLPHSNHGTASGMLSRGSRGLSRISNTSSVPVPARMGRVGLSTASGVGAADLLGSAADDDLDAVRQ